MPIDIRPYAAIGHDDDIPYAVGMTPRLAIARACEDAGYTAGEPVPHLDVDDACELYRAIPISQDDYLTLLHDGYDETRDYPSIHH